MHAWAPNLFPASPRLLLMWLTCSSKRCCPCGYKVVIYGVVPVGWWCVMEVYVCRALILAHSFPLTTVRSMQLPVTLLHTDRAREFSGSKFQQWTRDTRFVPHDVCGEWTPSKRSCRAGSWSPKNTNENIAAGVISSNSSLAPRIPSECGNATKSTVEKVGWSAATTSTIWINSGGSSQGMASSCRSISLAYGEPGDAEWSLKLWK